MLFVTLAEYIQQLEQTPSRLAMTDILSRLFKESSVKEIKKLGYLLQGRVAPLFDAVEFGIADKFMIRAVAQVAHVENDEVVHAFRKSGDLGIAAQELLSHGIKESQSQKNLSVSEVFDLLKDIAMTGGEGSQDRKIAMLSDLLRSVDALSVRYIVRIPLGKMRLGFSEMTMLDSLSWMLVGDKSLREPLEAAYNVRPDIGYILERVKTDGVEGLGNVSAVVGAPVLSALCQRLPTADEMVEKMGEVIVEPKYDGVRVQIHYQDSGFPSTELRASTIQESGGEKKLKVKTFSRNLENTTLMFPELEEMGKQIHATSLIMDAEAVGVDAKTGKILPFQETTTRKRKHEIAEAVKNVPLRFYVFDILSKDGKDLLGTPLSKRREILEHTINKGELFVLSPHIITSDPQEIRNYHDKQINNGLEGVVVKKWDGLYESGRRAFSWVKFKEEEGKTGKLKDTIDAVVMGYYRGEGKRTGFGIGALLVGVKKDESFVTVTKIGTGVSDDLWKELKKRLTSLEIAHQPKEYGTVPKVLIPDVWLSPEMVVELAGDDLTISKTHGAGYAVRFPRLVKIREDKGPQQTTTVKEIEQMFKNQ